MGTFGAGVSETRSGFVSGSLTHITGRTTRPTTPPTTKRICQLGATTIASRDVSTAPMW